MQWYTMAHCACKDHSNWYTHLQQHTLLVLIWFRVDSEHQLVISPPEPVSSFLLISTSQYHTSLWAVFFNKRSQLHTSDIILSSLASLQMKTDLEWPVTSSSSYWPLSKRKLTQNGQWHHALSGGTTSTRGPERKRSIMVSADMVRSVTGTV